MSLAISQVCPKAQAHLCGSSGYSEEDCSNVKSSARVAFLQEIQNDVTPFGGRLVSPYQADINLLRGWLNTCERDHRDSPTEQLQQHSPLPTLPQLRAIDVHEQRIVQIGRESRFVALSYVWGGPQQLQLTKSNHEELSQRGSLLAKNNEQKLPQTIKDAAFLVSLLKERYLWVDALCIIQDGPGKQEQIQNMDSVYASAVLALVAASGEDANAGILRIRPREKCHNFQQQFVTSVKGLKLANTLPDLSRTVDISIWNSRAWTYQERVLSKRLLFVSEGQTYFRCVHGDTFVEDLAAEHSPQGYSPPNPQIRGMEGTSNFEVYALAVENYGNRNLSFNDDAINAMAGILSYLRPRFRSDFLFGLPASELDMALLWQPSSSNIRRMSSDHQPLFPSWSWAGWSGGTRYLMGVEALSRVNWRDSLTGDSFSSDKYRQPDEKHVDTTPKWIKIEHSEDDDPSNKVFDAYYEHDKPDILFLHPIAPENQRSERQFINEGSEQLQFRALSAKFLINGNHTRTGTAVMPCQSLIDPEMEDHKLCSLTISNERQTIVGTVHVPGSIACVLSPGIYDFILLSRTRLLSDSSSANDLPSVETEYASRPVQITDATRLEQEEGSDLFDLLEETQFDVTAFDAAKPWCFYNVMLVDIREGISYRLGLGQVHIDAFLLAGPEWRDVSLG